ncbi:LysR family transcriptional regulator [Lysinibacillus sp. OL1_EC]|uniref:LysR family transcriptional regulator n=1 Tax=unclassified Lysinibacillus TaxID=2636778 RepID=UPI00103B8302|nr:MULTISPECIES: LysR family transcriptional regulator [unclassified Lysinibacillus]MCM0623594.1 LysR family transcriptional regulator [Lysinibacillus sp. OL1_EC]TBV89501.1 LysR family transcriptional regulator [Lysinibacillus sp. OL1]
MNINDLTIFRTVVQTGSFSKAATALNYTQSNISMKIQSLEALYDTTFFYRGHRGIRLTPKGEQFYELVLKMLHLYEKTFEIIHDTEEQRGVLRIGSMETTAALHLPTLLSTFHQAYEQVDITILTSPSQHNIERVENYELDGAFVTGPIYRENIMKKEFICEELVILTSSKHKPIKHLKDLEGSTVITFRHGCSYRAILEHWLHEEGIRPQNRMELGTLDGIIGCVAAELGITLLPRAIAEKYMATQALTLHKIKNKQAHIPTWFIYRKDEVQSPILTYFLEAIEAYDYPTV